MSCLMVMRAKRRAISRLAICWSNIIHFRQIRLVRLQQLPEIQVHHRKIGPGPDGFPGIGQLQGLDLRPLGVAQV